jgi:hypothetical protein
VIVTDVCVCVCVCEQQYSKEASHRTLTITGTPDQIQLCEQLLMFITEASMDPRPNFKV